MVNLCSEHASDRVVPSGIINNLIKCQIFSFEFTDITGICSVIYFEFMTNITIYFLWNKNKILPDKST